MAEINKEECEVNDENEETKEDSIQENNEVEEKIIELDQMEDQLLRLRADFSNYKRRTEESKSKMIDYALESVIKDILPIIDDFERALNSAETEIKEKSFYEGVELIYGQLKKVLTDNSVEEIDALGEEFDPNVHHAVFMEETEEYDENVVMEVMQKGYKLKDRVVRPAMVKVSK